MPTAQSAQNQLQPCAIRDGTPGNYLTVATVAADFGVSEETVRRWIRQGRITAYRVGPRRLRIDPHSLAALVVAR